MLISKYDSGSGKFTLTANTQDGWLLKDVLSRAVFHVDAAKIRVTTPDVGGSFGMKLFT